jgi:hypothetical protein
MANDDRKYLIWLRKQPCCVPGEPCGKPVEAHHLTGAGMGLRGKDADAIPLCRVHHRACHDMREPFAWDKYQRRIWHLRQASTCRFRYELEPEFPFDENACPF